LEEEKIIEKEENERKRLEQQKREELKIKERKRKITEQQKKEEEDKKEERMRMEKKKGEDERARKQIEQEEMEELEERTRDRLERQKKEEKEQNRRQQQKRGEEEEKRKEERKRGDNNNEEREKKRRMIQGLEETNRSAPLEEQEAACKAALTGLSPDGLKAPFRDEPLHQMVSKAKQERGSGSKTMDPRILQDIREKNTFKERHPISTEVRHEVEMKIKAGEEKAEMMREKKEEERMKKKRQTQAAAASSSGGAHNGASMRGPPPINPQAEKSGFFTTTCSSTSRNDLPKDLLPLASPMRTRTYWKDDGPLSPRQMSKGKMLHAGALSSSASSTKHKLHPLDGTAGSGLQFEESPATRSCSSSSMRLPQTVDRKSNKILNASSSRQLQPSSSSSSSMRPPPVPSKSGKMMTQSSSSGEKQPSSSSSSTTRPPSNSVAVIECDSSDEERRRVNEKNKKRPLPKPKQRQPSAKNKVGSIRWTPLVPQRTAYGDVSFETLERYKLSQELKRPLTDSEDEEDDHYRGSFEADWCSLAVQQMKACGQQYWNMDTVFGNVHKRYIWPDVEYLPDYNDNGPMYPTNHRIYKPIPETFLGGAEILDIEDRVNYQKDNDLRIKSACIPLNSYPDDEEEHPPENKRIRE